MRRRPRTVFRSRPTTTSIWRAVFEESHAPLAITIAVLGIYASLLATGLVDSGHRIVAALVRVGRHAATQEEIVRLLEQAAPGSFTHVAPAHGLCLERVWYDEGYAP